MSFQLHISSETFRKSIYLYFILKCTAKSSFSWLHFSYTSSKQFSKNNTNICPWHITSRIKNVLLLQENKLLMWRRCSFSIFFSLVVKMDIINTSILLLHIILRFSKLPINRKKLSQTDKYIEWAYIAKVTWEFTLKQPCRWQNPW